MPGGCRADVVGVDARVGGADLHWGWGRHNKAALAERGTRVDSASSCGHTARTLGSPAMLPEAKKNAAGRAVGQCRRGAVTETLPETRELDGLLGAYLLGTKTVITSACSSPGPPGVSVPLRLPARGELLAPLGDKMTGVVYTSRCCTAHICPLHAHTCCPTPCLLVAGKWCGGAAVESLEVRSLQPDTHSDPTPPNSAAHTCPAPPPPPSHLHPPPTIAPPAST
ncbi:hypothetical protein E2C01_052418 [Portunus trituberculatus]|uniref:Uncharacterized protein n=1 Tax=Portunus trituberculatus TaxID=210409 RepID=A0A5B7GLS2_PORTR|nr:hypothetical protein [Portunus trituberculatus]